MVSVRAEGLLGLAGASRAAHGRIQTEFCLDQDVEDAGVSWVIPDTGGVRAGQLDPKDMCFESSTPLPLLPFL